MHQRMRDNKVEVKANTRQVSHSGRGKVIGLARCWEEGYDLQVDIGDYGSAWTKKKVEGNCTLVTNSYYFWLWDV
jgi:hypothetical protein